MTTVVEERMPIEVYVGHNGHIVVRQDQGPLTDEPETIVIHPDDAPRVAEAILAAQAGAYLQRLHNAGDGV